VIFVEENDMTASASLILRGVVPALVTPFTKDGSAIDKRSLTNAIDSLLAAKVHGIVACGSTGEASTLSDDEYIEVVSIARDATAGKVPCIAGISASSTSRAVAMAKVIKELGCDGILVATPPYNKPSQAGIIEHFRAIYAATGLPLIAYNVPGRSGVAITSATLGALSRQGIIASIKEASSSIDSVADILVAVTPECQVLLGDDALFLPGLAYGARGIITVTGNACPNEMVALYDAFERGDTAEARRLQLDLLARCRASFIESNPVPIKAALAMKQIIAHDTVRLPLVPLAPENLERVRREFFG
jgi:4-hydroxy-tetrahydrodipicolinate synthase